jgi:hypothetical protein
MSVSNAEDVKDGDDLDQVLHNEHSVEINGADSGIPASV